MNEIQPTFKHALRVWWSFLWRNLLMILASMVLGGITGAILGFVLAALGVPVHTIRLVAGPVGAVIGLVLSVFPVYWILGKDFGSFRLILVSKVPARELEAPSMPPVS